MKRLLGVLLAALFLFACLPALAATAQISGDCAPGEAIVLYRPQAATGVRLSESGAPFFGDGISVEAVYDLSAGQDGSVPFDAENAPARIARVRAGTDTRSLLASLTELPFVLAAEPNYRYTVNAAFSDPYYASGLQWSLSESAGVHADALWNNGNVQSGAAGEIVVAVIDTGVDYDNPDLRGRLTPESLAFDAYPQPGGRIAQETSAGGHGTHVAGVIAAQTDNALGMAGMAGTCPSVRILPVKVFGGGTAYLGDVVAGIAHVIACRAQGINVVAANMSFGSESNHSSAITSFALAQLGEAGILPVRSAGNTCRDVEKYSVYPAVYENPYTLAVGGTGRDGAFAATYSNFNDAIVHMAAPGTAILSAYPKGRGGFVDSSGHPRLFDDFENTAASYTLTVAPVDWNGTVVSSDARVLVCQPQADGYYRQGHSLQFTFTPVDGYYDYRLELPAALSQLNAGETLGLRIRAHASGTAQGVLSAGTPPVVKSPLDNDAWTYLSLAADAGGRAYLWFSYYNAGPVTVSLDDLGIKPTNDVAYAYADGTSMAAPHVSGAYALLYAADPSMSLAERRARLIGSTRADASFIGKINAGTLDLSQTLAADTSAFAPVIDKIEQNGREITVSGWFFGDAPQVTLGGRSLWCTQVGSTNACTLTFTLPAGVAGVETLTLLKSNGRSFRMRFRYDAAGNMTELCDAPDGIVRTLVHDGDVLYCVCSTADGFALYRLVGNGWERLGSISSPGDRASRDDFTVYAAQGVLYIYDYNHIHRYDLSANAPLSDLAGPDALQASDAGFRTGTVALHNGRLMLLCGSYFAEVNGVRTRLYRERVCVYDGSAWQTAEALPCTLAGAQAVSCGNALFLFGVTPLGDKKALRYDGARWTDTTVPYDLSACTFGVLDGKILCFGDSQAAQGILRYDPAANAWDRLPYWGTGLPHTARGAVVNGRIYAITALQDHSRFILQYVQTQSPIDAVEANVSDAPTPTPTPTPTPVIPAPPATGAFAGMPLLCGLPALLAAALWKKRKRAKRP